MTPAAQDILATIRALCVDGPTCVTVAAIAERAGVSTRTVLRALPGMERAGLVTRDGGQGKSATFTCDNPRVLRDLSQVPGLIRNRQDMIQPGAEYTPVSDIDAARADRARLMADTSWRPRTMWARGQDAR